MIDKQKPLGKRKQTEKYTDTEEDGKTRSTGPWLAGNGTADLSGKYRNNPKKMKHTCEDFRAYRWSTKYNSWAEASPTLTWLYAHAYTAWRERVSRAPRMKEITILRIIARYRDNNKGYFYTDATTNGASRSKNLQGRRRHKGHHNPSPNGWFGKAGKQAGEQVDKQIERIRSWWHGDREKVVFVIFCVYHLKGINPDRPEFYVGMYEAPGQAGKIAHITGICLPANDTDTIEKLGTWTQQAIDAEATENSYIPDDRLIRTGFSKETHDISKDYAKPIYRQKSKKSKKSRVKG